MTLLNKPSLVFADVAVAGVETKYFRRIRCHDMNELVNMGEVENENGHDRVKVVKIRIDSRNDKKNQWQRQV